MEEKKKKWTPEEDVILVQAVSANPHNLSKCFIAVANKTGRTSKGVSQHWYKTVKFSEEGKKAMFTVGRGSTYPGKNWTPTCILNPIKKRKKNSLWVTLLSLLKIK